MAVKILIIIFNLILGNYAAQNVTPIDFFSNVDSPSRIVGGTSAASGSFPHLVALTHGLFVRTYFCGGSIISTRTVLTAAHCIDTVYTFGFLSRTLRIVAGTTLWNQGGQYYRVSGNVTHKHWEDRIVKNDIGILHTAAAMAYNDFVKPIPVSYEYVDGGVQAKVAGWGRTSVYGPVSTQLLELTTSTISAEQCAHEVQETGPTLETPSPIYDPRIEFCTLHSVGHGMCRGDSGSGLSQSDRGILIGVVSWGFPCALGAPDVYVRVSAYEPWIQMNTRF